eukprot:332857-Prorocentrum_minimum.AAC.2
MCNTVLFLAAAGGRARDPGVDAPALHANAGAPAAVAELQRRRPSHHPERCHARLLLPHRALPRAGALI